LRALQFATFGEGCACVDLQRQILARLLELLLLFTGAFSEEKEEPRSCNLFPEDGTPFLRSTAVLSNRGCMIVDARGERAHLTESKVRATFCSFSVYYVVLIPSSF
jgi:hypothetical protein